MRSIVILKNATLALLLGAAGVASAGPIPLPFNTEASDSSVHGDGGQNLQGYFRQQGGPPQYGYVLGTGTTAGYLTLNFATPFTDGPGDDVAILTSSTIWGPLANKVMIQLYLQQNLEASFVTSLSAGELYEFDLPGTDLSVDRIVIKNISVDPNNTGLTQMGFDDVRVAYAYPAPDHSFTFGLFGTSLIAIAGFNRWRKSSSQPA